ncbi:MAG: thiolase family protein [Leptospirales bacterium]|nr:thiolase family protein [Leptospirales bacterium]
MSDAYILDGRRSAFGAFGGALHQLHPVELAVHASTQALLAAGVAASAVDECIFGNVLLADSQSIYFARHVALRSGAPVSAPALTVNRLCGSGLEAIAQAAQQVRSGVSQCVLAGGAESMSHAPHLLQSARWGQKLGGLAMEDSLLSGLTDGYSGLPMGMTAENLARDFSISREDQDAWALRSQTRAEGASDSGRMALEIAPLRLRQRKAEVNFDRDEFIRGAASASALPGLPPAFDPQGTVSAGNSSGINDGAAALLVVSEAFLKNSGRKPRARILGCSAVGCDPSRMGIGPALAIPRLLARHGLQQSDIDLFEINEAFAAQTLAVIRQLKLDPERTNVNGGAIALGHPLAASGARLALSLAIELEQRSLRYGVASLCIGGGQGIAMLLEAC